MIKKLVFGTLIGAGLFYALILAFDVFFIAAEAEIEKRRLY